MNRRTVAEVSRSRVRLAWAWRVFASACMVGFLAPVGCGGGGGGPCVLTAMVRPTALGVPANMPGLEATDLFAFPSPADPAAVVLVMNVHPLIPSGQGALRDFDPNALYQFKIDNTGDYVEDLVIQLQCTGSGPTQQVQVSGPSRPRRPGNVTTANPFDSVTGTINTPFTLSNRAKVFAGGREDPAFFDLDAFYSMLPDRANFFGPVFTNINGVNVSTTPMNPDLLQLNAFRSPGQALDYFKGLNTLSIVVELPRSLLGGGKINLWATVQKGLCNGPQVSRQGRPLVTTVFPTVADRRQVTNNMDNPTDDPGYLAKDVQKFMTSAAGRSPSVAFAAVKLLVPDVLTVDLSSRMNASYLSLETGGANSAAFGGRALGDDVADALFGIIFGNTLSRIGPTPDDGLESPRLTTDNVGPGAKHFQAVFPYLGPPL